MRVARIAEIQKALEKLSEFKLPVQYECARNIKKCKSVVTKGQELSQELFDKFCDKGKDGKPVEYPADATSPRPYKKISDKEREVEFRAEIDKMEKEEHDIQFVKIPVAAIKGRDFEKLGTVIEPLLGVVIEEE